MTEKPIYEELEEEAQEMKEEADRPKKLEEMLAPEQTIVNKQYSGFERRKYSRYNLIHLPKKGVKLIIRNSEYKVLDISQGGLRCSYDNEIELGTQIEGIIKYSEDESKAIEGKVVWAKNREVGLKFKNHLPLFKISSFQY